MGANPIIDIDPVFEATLIRKSGSLALSYVAKIANYIILLTDYTINCTANSFTVTLPSAISNIGAIYIIKNSGTGIITVNTTLLQTIDGELSVLLGTKVSVTLQSTGLSYIIL